MSPASSAPRRSPRQERSQFTVDAIFEAVARIVATQGEDALTTNRIAEVAGVSVGSLYQYFPSKEAILLAMLDQQVRGYVRHYLQAFGGGPQEGRALARLSWKLDYRASVLISVRGASERLALHLQRVAQEQQMPAPSATQLFVLTRAFMGAVRAASLEQSPLLDSPEFEQALVELCIATLAPGAGLGGGATMAP